MNSNKTTNQSIEPTDLMNLGNSLKEAYCSYFQNDKIEELYKQALCLSKTQIELTTYFKRKEELDYLSFDEKIRFNIDEYTYIIFSLNGFLQEFVINGEKQNLFDLNLLQALEILRLRNIPIDLTGLLAQLQQLTLISYVYNYAYSGLEEQIKDRMDIIRAGMFKNAYYNILALKDQNYIKLLIESPFPAKTR